MHYLPYDLGCSACISDDNDVLALLLLDTFKDKDKTYSEIDSLVIALRAQNVTLESLNAWCVDWTWYIWTKSVTDVTSSNILTQSTVGTDEDVAGPSENLSSFVVLDSNHPVFLLFVPISIQHRSFDMNVVRKIEILHNVFDISFNTRLWGPLRVSPIFLCKRETVNYDRNVVCAAWVILKDEWC